jgi:hypothetical protein
MAHDVDEACAGCHRYRYQSRKRPNSVSAIASGFATTVRLLVNLLLLSEDRLIKCLIQSFPSNFPELPQDFPGHRHESCCTQLRTREIVMSKAASSEALSAVGADE